MGASHCQIRLSPEIRFPALFAGMGVFDFAFWFRGGVAVAGLALLGSGLAGVGQVAIHPGDLEGGGEQDFRHLLEPPAGDGIIRHAVAGTFAARLPGTGRHQAYAFHLRGPFGIVIAPPAGLAVVMLPEMHHLMHQGLQAMQHPKRGEIVRIDGDFVRGCGPGRAGELLGAEIAAAMGLALHGDQAIGQGVAEQLGIEHSIGMLEGAVLPGGGGWAALAHAPPPTSAVTNSLAVASNMSIWLDVAFPAFSASSLLG